MAVTKQKFVMTDVDNYGNKKILYPVTKAECVEGLEDKIKETATGGGKVDVTVDSATGTASHGSAEIYALVQAGNLGVAVMDGVRYQYNGATLTDGVCDTVEFYRTEADENGIVTTEYVRIHDDMTADVTYNEVTAGKSAYETAQAGGYSGTEEEFAEKLATDHIDWFGVGISIPEAADLDTYKTNGKYYCNSESRAQTLSNRPDNMNTNFVMWVFSRTSSSIKSQLMLTLAGKMYIRSSSSSGWRKWVAYTTSEEMETLFEEVKQDLIDDLNIWYTDSTEEVLLSETEVTVDSDTYYAELPGIELIEGERYAVTCDGTSYECLAYTAGSDENNCAVIIGSLTGTELDPAGEYVDKGNNEPFCIFCGFGAETGLYTSTEGTHTISVSHLVESIHKIDPKYLPTVTPQMFGAVADGETDDTAAIQAAIDSLEWGGTVYFPIGKYKHTGITIRQSCNLVGESIGSSELINVGGGDSVTFAAGASYGLIYNLGVFGNGTYGVGAPNSTAQRGFVFGSDTCHWTFRNVWVRHHTKEGFYACGVGHVNNIHIMDSHVDGGGGGMKFVQTDSSNQINNINIIRCNIAWLSDTGVSVWGQNINIENNTIQLCLNYGVDVDVSADITTPATGSSNYTNSQGINIQKNYFEQCYNNFIHAKAWYSTASSCGGYIQGLTIEDNYGFYGSTNQQAIPSTGGCVKLESMEYSTTQDQISGFVYKSNGFQMGDGGATPSTCYILDGGGNLNTRNYIFISAIGSISRYESKFINLGQAIVFGRPVDKILFGKSHCLSHNYTATGMETVKNETSGATTTTIYFDLGMDINRFTEIGFYLTTDSTSYYVVAYPCSYEYTYDESGNVTGTKLNERDDWILGSTTLKSGSQLIKTDAGSAKAFKNYSAQMMKVVVKNNTPNTSFSLSNLICKHV